MQQPPPQQLLSLSAATRPQQSHQVQCDTRISPEEETDSSATPALAAADQPAPDHPAVCASRSLSEGRQTPLGSSASPACNSDASSDMQIRDGTDLTTAARVEEGKSDHRQRNPASPAQQDPSDMKAKTDKDLSRSAKSKKQSEGGKKSSQAKKSGATAPDQKGKSNQAPASDAPSPPADSPLPDARSRKTHDSGDSTVSLDSGTDVRSPAGAGDQKSSDRSSDSPGPFKSDVSQGSPCNWGAASDSHSEVRASLAVCRDSIAHASRPQQGSSDSGKGSEIQSSASYSPLNQFSLHASQRVTANLVYQFEMPTELVGRLIGRRGTTIKEISAESRARIVVNDFPFENCDHLKVCTIDGQYSCCAKGVEADAGMTATQVTDWRSQTRCA